MRHRNHTAFTSSTDFGKFTRDFCAPSIMRLFTAHPFTRIRFMSEFFFPHQPVPAKDLFAAGDQDAVERFLEQNSQCRSGLLPQSPYCSGYNSEQDRLILNHLQRLRNAHRYQLSCAIDEFGEQTHALANFYDRQLASLDLEASASLVGAGASAKNARLTAFQRSMVEYQEALIKLNAHRKNGRGGRAGMGNKIELEALARRRYAAMARHYRMELNSIARPEFQHRNRGHILNNADRGITLAKHHRSSKLIIDNVAEVQRLDRLARSIRYAGNGLIALDAGLRVRNVHESYQRNENWQRQFALEATGFGGAGIFGIAAAQGTVATLSAIGLGLTPVGWVVVIGVGIAAGITASSAGDSIGKKLASILFDWWG